MKVYSESALYLSAGREIKYIIIPAKLTNLSLGGRALLRVEVRKRVKAQYSVLRYPCTLEETRVARGYYRGPTPTVYL